jgi:GNAT superfamily N-acetyltransferase
VRVQPVNALGPTFSPRSRLEISARAILTAVPTPSPVVVRKAEPADGPAFLSLVRALAEFEQLPPPDADAERRLIADAFGSAPGADPNGSVTRGGATPRYELWVAVIDGIIVAYAATFGAYSTFLARPTLYLEDLFVAPAARRRGVATAILARLEAVARERGCGRFEWTVLDWNVDAQKLYEGIGAKVLGEWKLVRKTL